MKSKHTLQLKRETKSLFLIDVTSFSSISSYSNELDPYPHLNGEQQLGALESSPDQTVT